MIGGVVKYFRFSVDYVLWEISHANLIMLMATIPRYKSSKDEGGSPDQDFEDLTSLDNFLRM
jgi:hypothetical protein